ncbi:MAG: hypothetical protein JNM07_09565 [Phycisphaerae bacterium]|nr:hypothetical protein [Phycisphaerae bacterium]
MAAQPPKRARLTAQDRYDRLTREMLHQHSIRVRKWRSSMSGVAWEVEYADGSRVKLIESPRPKSPMSASIFLHEVGHHAIGLGAFSPRCLEEYHAWAWSLERMKEHDIEITEAVLRRVHLSLWYAVDKAKRRGIRRIPDELAPYLKRPANERRRSTPRPSNPSPR